MRKVQIAAVALSLLGLLCLRAQNAPGTAPDYARDIRPIFEKNCYQCHGEKLQSGGLRLDRQAAANPEIYRRVAGLGNTARMPMGGRLSDDQIGLIKNWIDTAPKQKHWAFVPPVRPALPAVKNAAWAHNPIDAFVLAKLETESLQPSTEADRATLLRRVSLDLTGLPPTPAEVDAFVADTAPNAYEKQVDRLLASPHYGERWARHWLDAARYADSDGYEKDKPRFVWFYRDWVINAFNRDLPYDQFVIEQIAGDLLPNADAGSDRRHRLSAQFDDQRRRRRRSRAVPHGSDVRPHGRHRQGHSRRHDSVRAVPQPQIRSADAGRVLPDVRVPE